MATNKKAPKILVVDDERAQRTFLSEFLAESGFLVASAASASEALKLVHDPAEDFWLVITDLSMPEMSGIELIRKARAAKPELSFIMMTAYASIESAVEALKEGAQDYLLKPLELDEVLIRVKKTLGMRETHRRMERLEQENRELRAPVAPVARDPAMIKLIEELGRIGQADASVLLLGETGVGKEVMARHIHDCSARQAAPFVAVNCSAIPEGLAESEFFGHEKGAFTGADRRSAGFFERAEGGTLFLDEIGELDLKLQPKILRALEERTVRRVGGTADIPVDIRLVAATHRDLKALVSEGRFREDLYYRLNVVQVRIPPLRERRGDIEELARSFVQRYASRMRMRVKRIDPGYLAALARYPFPGNVRELANAVERSLIFHKDGELLAESLPADIREPGGATSSSAGPASLPGAARQSGKLAELMLDFERRAIQDALAAASGDIDRAAVALDIARSTLYSKMSKLGIR